MAQSINRKRRRKARHPSPHVIDILTLLSEYAPNGNGLYVDYGFQRTNFAWPKKAPRDFISDIFTDGMTTALSYADIESGKKAEKRGTGYDKYVAASKGGNSNVSLDGLQRTTALMRFVKGEITVTGEFTDAWGGVHQLNNCTYNTLPSTLRMTFDTTPVTIMIYSHRRYGELPALFRRINSGDALNRMEMRNSYFSPIATFMRSMSRTPEATIFWQNLQGATKIGRMKDIDRLCNLSIYTIRDYNNCTDRDALIDTKPNDIVKDALYSIGDGYSDFGSPSPYIESEMYAFRLIFELTLDIISAQTEFEEWNKRSGLPVYAFQSLFFFVKELISRNLMIANSLSDIDVNSANTIVRRVHAWNRDMKKNGIAKYSADTDAWTARQQARDAAVSNGSMTKEQRNDIKDPEPKENDYFQQYHLYPTGVANRKRLERDVRCLVDKIIANNSVTLFDVEKDIDLYVNSSTLEGMKTVLQVA